MKEKLLAGDATPSLESLHGVRLTALMHDLMNREGKMGAAQILGVNHKTLTAAVESGNLTPRLSDALEKVLLSREAEAFVELRERVRELESRMEAVEARARSIPGEIREAVEMESESREKGVGTASEPTERPAGMGASPQGEGPQDAAGSEQRQPRSSPPRRLFRTTRPSVVTQEPQPGDEQAFGEAWPLVEEWRGLRESHSPQGRGLSWLVGEERLRELETALIGEHELTMPPDTDPWDSLGRRTQVRWRTQTLDRVRGERVRAQWRRWIRRVLTLGLWRS